VVEGVRDPLDEVITLAEAAAVSGKAPHTLTLQAARGKLRAKKVGHTWITTRHWLEQYLRTFARARRGTATDPNMPAGPPDPRWHRPQRLPRPA
jgi:hypothetical protein